MKLSSFSHSNKGEGAVLERSDIPWDKYLQTIPLDRGSAYALHAQLRNGLRQIILHSLREGDMLLPELEITRRLNLSQGTVRRALTELASEGLLERRRAVGTVVRHPPAAALKSLAIIAADFTGLQLGAIIALFQGECQERGISLQIIRMGPTDDSQVVDRNLAFAPSLGGVVLLGLPDVVVRSLTRGLSDRGYRTVGVDRSIDDYPASQIGLCNRSAIEMGITHLTEVGHRRILFLVGEPEESDAVKERCRFFEEIALLRGLTEARVFHCGSHAWENGADAVVRSMPAIWGAPHRPTAIFAISDVCAIGALGWLQQQGVNIPGTASILSYDGTDLTSYSHPKLTTLVQPLKQYVEKAFEILVDRGNSSPRRVFFPPSYRDGGTVAPLALCPQS